MPKKQAKKTKKTPARTVKGTPPVAGKAIARKTHKGK
jgi:hypothetical protein